MIKRSDSIAKLGPKLAQIQAKCTEATKSAENPHLRSKYADLGNCLEVVRPLLAEHQVMFAQFPSLEGKMLKLITLLTFEDEWIEFEHTFPAEEQRGSITSQKLGSAITYARRYTLKSIFNFAEKDDNGHAQSQQQQRPGQQQQLHPKQEVTEALKRKHLLDFLKKHNYDLEKKDLNGYWQIIEGSKPKHWPAVLEGEGIKPLPAKAD